MDDRRRSFSGATECGVIRSFGVVLSYQKLENRKRFVASSKKICCTGSVAFAGRGIGNFMEYLKKVTKNSQKILALTLDEC